MRSAELIRIASSEGSVATEYRMPDWASSVVVQNPLAAIGYIAWRQVRGGPSNTTGYDLIIPGAALVVHPIPGESVRWITAQVIYPGAVPAADAGFFFIVTAMEEQLAPSVGPLA